jgi:inosine-uridine nucleoside N-ribohydrolase
MIKILLDTDIGTDVDDAVCLAYLLKHPQCELLGITTVTGEAGKRAALASVLCQHAGVDVSIYPGREHPLIVPQKQPIAQQAAALPRWAHQSQFPTGEAIIFMQRTICANPGEVVLLTIGPLSNVGQLFAEYPEVPGLLKGLVMMGGVFNPAANERSVEWNIAGDPHAADIVYHSHVALHRSVGLDVTQQVVLPADEVRRAFTVPILQPVLDFAEIWFNQFYPAITFHDPLAAATIFEPGVCTYQAGVVTVDLDEQPGRTDWQPGGEQPPHEIAVSVDVPRYLSHYFDVLNRAG